MKVKIETFRTLKDFDGKRKFKKGGSKSGVYIWGFSLNKSFDKPRTKSDFFPYYVGKVYDDIYGRTHEHIAALYGGNYSVFDINKCSKDKNFSGVGVIHKLYQDNLKKYNKILHAKKSLPANLKLPNSSYPYLFHFPEGIHTMYQYHVDKSSNYSKTKCKKQIDWMIKHFCIMYITPVKIKGKKNIVEHKADLKIIRKDLKQNKINKNIANKSIKDSIEEISKIKKSINHLEKIVGNIITYDKLITKSYNKPSKNLIKIEINGKNEFLNSNNIFSPLS